MSTAIERTFFEQALGFSKGPKDSLGESFGWELLVSNGFSLGKRQKGGTYLFVLYTRQLFGCRYRRTPQYLRLSQSTEMATPSCFGLQHLAALSIARSG